MRAAENALLLALAFGAGAQACALIAPEGPTPRRQQAADPREPAAFEKDLAALEAFLDLERPKAAKLERIDRFLEAHGGVADPRLAAVRERRGRIASGDDTRLRREPRTGLELLWIPGGTFELGCVDGDARCSDDEKPARSVTVGGFWLGRTEVTVAAYAACAEAGACSKEPRELDEVLEVCNWKNGRTSHPINCVSWDEASAFCRWIGGRLPTAAEWEHAAKSGGRRTYPWGNERVDASRASYCDVHCPDALEDSVLESWERQGWIDRSQDDGWAGTAPVGSYRAGATRWGLLDMAGNVREWTATDFGDRKEMRGGCWFDDPPLLRVSYRGGNVPSVRGSGIGFRCAQ